MPRADPVEVDNALLASAAAPMTERRPLGLLPWSCLKFKSCQGSASEDLLCSCMTSSLSWPFSAGEIFVFAGVSLSAK